ncbi:hypothetical protein TEQG_02690 [Trichophyton equinum CBS 127.97]|uniref:Uncharacterized protein n=1 Tax=Trichophyton equinum (strain ATCC MYA-4606 / CBS 127.97) TaxID=559882 RepID=F2PP41_TRIEC|nr:hypothetical protein TEQG_02690 [Trichophyton equinum CBS 127.97]
MTNIGSKMSEKQYITKASQQHGSWSLHSSFALGCRAGKTDVVGLLGVFSMRVHLEMMKTASSGILISHWSNIRAFHYSGWPEISSTSLDGDCRGTWYGVHATGSLVNLEDFTKKAL